MISVCMATYNGADFIKSQLSSIIIQLSEEDEVIISDDGSTDNTLQVIEDFNDPRIRIIKNPRNWLPIDLPIIGRVKRNFEAALSQAKGEYIFLADQDDEWLPGRVETCLSYLKKNKLVVCDCIITSDNGEQIFPSYYKIIKPNSNVIRTIYKSSYHGCCMAFDSSMKPFILPFPDANIGHDTWIGLICSIKGNVYFTDKPLVNYRRHSKTVTQCGFRSTRTLRQKLSYRAVLIWELFKRIFTIWLK